MLEGGTKRGREEEEGRERRDGKRKEKRGREMKRKEACLEHVWSILRTHSKKVNGCYT